MNLIIPMAGRGSRLRPHTLTVPKPLVPIAGKPIVQRLVEDLTSSLREPVKKIAFIIGDFGNEVEAQLKSVAADLGAEGLVVRQEQPLGTAHAILCAKELLDGPTMIAFADTLFKADFDFDLNTEGIIWAQEVEDPSAFGVLKLEGDKIVEFVEKPTTFVSNLAIVGIYYVNDGAALRKELQYLIDNDIKEKGEYQLTNALDALNAKGTKFVPGVIKEWLDCGNKAAVIHTNNRILEFKKETEELVSPKATIENSIILEPCFIAEGAKISNSVIGPHVSIGKNTVVENSVLKNSMVQNDSAINDANLVDAMIGNHVKFTGKSVDYSIGDYTTIK